MSRKCLERADLARSGRLKRSPEYVWSLADVRGLVEWEFRNFDVDLMDGVFLAFYRTSNEQKLNPRVESVHV